MSQSGAAQGFAIRACLAYLTHLCMMNSHIGPTELPASESFQFSEYLLVCEDPRPEQHNPAWDNSFVSLFFKRWVWCLAFKFLLK